MQNSTRKTVLGSHTIVLERRGVTASRQIKYGQDSARTTRSLSTHTRNTQHASRVPEPQNWTMEAGLPTRLWIDSLLGRTLVRVLVLLMIFQPVYVAFGMELEGQPTETVADESSTTDVTANTEDDSVAPSNEVENTGDTQTISSDVPDATDETITEEVVTDNDGDTANETADEDGVDTADGTEGDAQEGTETTEGDNTSAGDEEESATSTEEVVNTEDEDTIATTTATTTDEVAIEDEDAVGVEGIPQNPESAYIFSDGDCTLVAEGEFYCVRNDVPRIENGDPRVYAEKDREGDREIYYFDGVEVHRVTNNSYDDFAPVFEDKTLRIVWQAMINDRLQVMVYDIPTETTRQITTSSQNSSNPDIEGDTVVWQEWVDTNWEIMMTDVDNQGSDFDIKRLTDNAVHDMFPQAYEDLVTWQTEKGTSWEVTVYDIRTEKTTTLEKNEGTKYENPRFVLLFDSKHENGDVETIGYDLDTGEMMELGTKANPQPQAPASPKDKTSDALPREATTASKVKVGKEDDTLGNDLPL